MRAERLGVGINIITTNVSVDQSDDSFSDKYC